LFLCLHFPTQTPARWQCPTCAPFSTRSPAYFVTDSRIVTFTRAVTCDTYATSCALVAFSVFCILVLTCLLGIFSFLSSAVLANMPTKLEIERQEKIARNRKLLNDLMGRINKENDTRAAAKQTVVKTQRRKSVPIKRSAPPNPRAPPSSDGASKEDPRSTKRARTETPQLGLRRSSRHAGRTPPDYQAESETRLPRLVTTKIGTDHDREPNRRSGKRTHDPYD
jgi:hypothetical protein